MRRGYSCAPTPDITGLRFAGGQSLSLAYQTDLINREGKCLHINNYSLVSEIPGDRTLNQRFTHDPFPFVIISRYRENICICLGHIQPKGRGAITHVISALLHIRYGIRLKWEPHGDRYVCGQGSIDLCGVDFSLVRKGVFWGALPLEEGEYTGYRG